MHGCVIANAGTPGRPRYEARRRPVFFLSVDAPHTHAHTTMAARTAASMASVHSRVRPDLGGFGCRRCAIDKSRSSAPPSSISERDDTEQGARQRIKIPLANARLARAMGCSFTIRRQRASGCRRDRVLVANIGRERRALPTTSGTRSMQAGHTGEPSSKVCAAPAHRHRAGRCCRRRYLSGRGDSRIAQRSEVYPARRR